MAANWRPSTLAGGNPGTSDPQAFAGDDPDADNDGDGMSAFLEHALGTSDLSPDARPLAVSFAADGSLTLSFPHNLAADDTILEAQTSDDLLDWSAPWRNRSTMAPGACWCARANGSAAVKLALPSRHCQPRILCCFSQGPW